jgi:hypothetical protein
MRAGLKGRSGSSILLVVFLLSLPAVTRRIYASDEIQYFSWLRSVAFDHDADFDNDYRHFYASGATRDPLFAETFLTGVNEHGRRHNFATIGPALLWAPFYAVGHLAARVGGAPADGYSQPYITAIAFGSALYGFLAVLLSRALVHRTVGHRPGSAAAVWLGTPLLFYMYVAPGFSHACSAFAVSLFLWVWLQVRRNWSPSGAALLGVSGALVAMMREQDAVMLAGPALDFALHVWRGRRTPGALASDVRAAAAGVGTSLLAYGPQLAAYHAINGHFGPTRFVLRKMTWTSPHFLQVLFSPEHGLFAWTPLALVAVGGLVWLAVGQRRDAGADVRWIGLLALVMFALEVYVSGCVESWTVAGAFGQRRFVATTPLLALGLAALAPAAAGARRVVWAALLVLCVWWNLGLMAQFGLHTIDRQRLTLADNARQTFLELPARAPSVAWEYVTNRSAFYGRPRQP